VLPYRTHRKTHHRTVEYTHGIPIRRHARARHSHSPRAATAPPPHPTPNRVRRRRRRGTEATAISAPTVPRPCVRHGRACAGRPPTISARRRRIESEVGRCAPLQLYTASTTTRTREDQRRSPHPAFLLPENSFARWQHPLPASLPPTHPAGAHQVLVGGSPTATKSDRRVVSNKTNRTHFSPCDQ
jgi:hypothetical protein